MNGDLDAVCTSTGNDFGGYESWVHAYAAKNGKLLKLNPREYETGIIFKFWMVSSMALRPRLAV